ncbi:hypothetical protein [uncultured Clostridium sp.]|uniref:hypothetical protein n=1 Tax=uncultured Clostridium sp. TaxID=59620 RepID=UPI0025E1BA3F|nr:hypothetical protein [uncultured Clostridium sp.]
MAIIILIIGLSLIVINFRAIQKDEKVSFEDVLSKKQENISDLELKIAEVRKDMAESILDIQQEILELKNSLNMDENNVKGNNSGKKNSTNNYNEKESELSYLLNADSDVIDNINKNSKTKRIEELLKNGFNDDEICEKIQLGKGEVQLVRELLKKQKK